jgi:choline kinase
MDAILYVAGRANRLGALAATRNKVLLEFDGKSLLERHLMLLEKVGVPRLHVVTGHLRQTLQAEFPQLEARYKVKIIEHFNPDYTEGSVLSMHASLPALVNVASHVLIMDGDVLYDGRMLQRLIQSPERTVLLVDQDYSTIDDDPVMVPVRNGRPFEFLKKWKGEADFVGESVGFFKVHRDDLPALIRETCARTVGSARSESYDEVLRAMVKEGLFAAEDITGLPWTEIDFPHDLDYAAKFISPHLQDS